jgi:hypothetical protein
MDGGDERYDEVARPEYPVSMISEGKYEWSVSEKCQ